MRALNTTRTNLSGRFHSRSLALLCAWPFAALAQADTFRADAGMIAQRKMDNPPFIRGHRFH